MLSPYNISPWSGKAAPLASTKRCPAEAACARALDAASFHKPRPLSPEEPPLGRKRSTSVKRSVFVHGRS
jgi:hypothetical protein